jgi:hypothetical protein
MHPEMYLAVYRRQERELESRLRREAAQGARAVRWGRGARRPFVAGLRSLGHAVGRGLLAPSSCCAAA